MSANPLNDCPFDQDMVRRAVGPTEVYFINGEMHLSMRGVRILCQAIIDGRAEGNINNARMMLAALPAE